MGKTFDVNSIYPSIIEPSKTEFIRLPYPKKEVEHLVDQLIRLDSTGKISPYGSLKQSKAIEEAMDTINKALKGYLGGQLIITKGE